MSSVLRCGTATRSEKPISLGTKLLWKLVTLETKNKRKGESEMNHTPGPWKIDESYATMLMIASSDGVPIAEIQCGMLIEFGAVVIDPDKEELANADLIAAAPEMYSALKALLACTIVAKHPEDAKAFFQATEMAETAIAKAKLEAENHDI
jgi:hypothetical protein